MDKLFYVEKVHDSVSYYQIYKKDYKRVVFLLHGLYGAPKDWLPLGKKLALEGSLVIIPQAKWHGYKTPDNFEYLFSGNSFMNSMTIVMNSYIESIINILNYLITKESVNCKKVGVVGFSMGAYVSYLLPLFEQRFSAIIPISGSPYFSDDKAIEHFKIDNLEIPESASIQAGQKPELFVDKNILIMHNKDDQTVSYIGSHKFYEILKPMMKRGKVEMILQEIGGHRFYSYFGDMIVDWFNKYL
jgi:dienelactone hydrolase